MVALFAVVAMAGCSSAFKQVQTWEGPEAQPGQVALLHKPGSVKIVSVNGREMANYLTDDLELTYELLPGQNTVVFTYKTIWAKQGVVNNGESKVHVIETDPQQVVINARAGESYHFVLPTAETRSEAESIRQNFQAKVVNEQNRQVAVSSEFVKPAPQLPTLPGAPATAAAATTGAAATTAPSTAPAQAPTVPAAANNLPTLEGLKVLWERASTEDKKNFLRWAFQ
ncbi:DUF2057 family protein [Marinobacter halodurans]|nr:DUF2057 family protein [Marinobacter halodurans]